MDESDNYNRIQLDSNAELSIYLSQKYHCTQEIVLF